jgi:hypothetical protein
VALAFFWRKDGLRAEPADQYDASAQTMLIRCGVTDKAGKTWTGSLEPESSGARVVALEGYHFQPPDKITSQWDFATRPWTASFQQVDLSPARPGPRPVFPNGVYATVTGGPTARFRLTLDGASHGFTLADLTERKLLALAGGNVEIELVPTPVRLSNTEGEADFPALAAGASGRLAVVWQEWIRDKDRIVSREFAGLRWGPVEVLETSETSDVFRPAAAYDGTGALHLVWSAQVDGNWDLYTRRKTAGGWELIQRLTQAAGPDFNQKLIADSKGDLWLAWQAFRGGQSDIFLKRFAAGRWGPEIKVSESPANDWEPSLTAAPNGTIWAGWDGYDGGNYDVFVRPVVGGVPGPIRQITRSPRFQAHVSLATDPQSNLWVGFDEAEVNWGKDYGYLVKDRGSPLYQSRRLRLVR